MHPPSLTLFARSLSYPLSHTCCHDYARVFLISIFSFLVHLSFILASVRFSMDGDELVDVEVVSYTFSIIGDSNIQRNLVDYNCGNREDLRSAQLVPCTSFSTFSGSLSKIRPESNVLILSCLSNFLRDSDSSSDPTVRITAVLEEFRSILFPYCNANPDLSIMLAPPQFSRVPIWYSESMGLILQLISSLIMSPSVFHNLHLLPAFPNQVFQRFFLIG